MGRQLTWLSDAEWARIEPLPPRGRKGTRRVDDRRVISGIAHMLRIGALWRDCPPEYGPYTTIYNPLQPVEPAGRLARYLRGADRP
jgi:transposase